MTSIFSSDTAPWKHSCLDEYFFGQDKLNHMIIHRINKISMFSDVTIIFSKTKRLIKFCNVWAIYGTRVFIHCGAVFVFAFFSFVEQIKEECLRPDVMNSLYFALKYKALNIIFH